METENKDGSGVLETTETEETVEETPEQLKARIAELEATVTKTAEEKAELESKNKQLFERARKSKESKETKDTDLSTQDILYLGKSSIHEDDIDEVLDYAKKMNVSVRDAHNHYKPILEVREAERKTAAATQTGNARRGASAPNAGALLEKAERGELPESESDIEKLAEARMASRLK